MGRGSPLPEDHHPPQQRPAAITAASNPIHRPAIPTANYPTTTTTTMARFFILVSLSMSMALLGKAQSVVGVASGLGVGAGVGIAGAGAGIAGPGAGFAGPGAGFGSGYSDPDSTNVPVSPIAISPETDFLPVNNVQPIVNVFPTDFNDYSGFSGAGYGAGYGYGGDDFSGDYGYGYGGGYGGSILGYN